MRLCRRRAGRAVLERPLGWSMRPLPNDYRAVSSAQPRGLHQGWPASLLPTARVWASGPTTTVRGSNPAARRASAIAGMAEGCQPRCQGRPLDIGPAMEMRIDRNDTIDRTSEEPANGLLADSLPRGEKRRPAACSRDGRDQNEPLGAIAAQRSAANKMLRSFSLGRLSDV